MLHCAKKKLIAESAKTPKLTTTKKSTSKKSNEAAPSSKKWKDKVFVEIIEFSDAIVKPVLSSTATEQEDLENMLFLELNIVK